MAIINFGSLNIDHTYSVAHFVQPGETAKSAAYNIYCGGKGLNQSIAAARAGAEVIHAGMVGAGGELLAESLRESGVDVSRLGRTEAPQGHAVIQVSPSGENGIIICAGSNFEVSREYVDSVLDTAPGRCHVMLQNEISNVEYIIEESARRGHRVMFNASPFEEALGQIDLNSVAWLMVNEIEGAQMSGRSEPERIIAALRERNPELGVVLTLGGDGAICSRGDETVRQGIFRVITVDTTGAGDTFTGFFAAAIDGGSSLGEAAERAAAAAAIAVTRAGAAPSIPTSAEVDGFLSARGF